ncbi:hypothetical protein ACFQV2_30905 [Actinokineospora soli]|uniref:Uncharacterized protein n=1 Tax=Actinokineospora soli TaxID=1048753 RepID=A0ABW2TWK9_9PSEU
MIVRNNRSSLFSSDAEIFLYDVNPSRLGEWQCPSSGVAANSWSVCFGQTLIHPNDVAASGFANSHGLVMSPYV